MTKDLQDIVKGCVSGKIKAQEKLYSLFARKMFGVTLLYTKDYAEAEDIIQEGFIKVFRNIGQFKCKGSLEGWIRKIMVNTALEKYRKQYHLFPVADFEEIYGEISYNDAIENISVEELMKFIHELTPQYRVVFSLYAIEGYSHQEISEMLDISEGTSKSNLSRARKILQERVEKFFNQTEDYRIHKMKIVENC